MPTPQELEEQRKRIQAQLMGGLDVGGQYTDEYGIPKMSSPSYYLDFTVPKGMGMGLGLGIPTKESLAAQLANVRIQQELLDNPALDQAKRLKELNYEIGIDYLNKPVTQMSDIREGFLDRTPGTMIGEAPIVSSVFDTNVQPAPPYNRPAPAGETPSLGMAMRPQSKAARGQQNLPLNWEAINNRMALEMKQSEYDTKPLTRGLERAYIRVRQEQSSLTPQEALGEALKQIQGVSNAPFVAESDPDKFVTSGPADPYYQAWVRQTFGENGIPDLNAVQNEYVKGQMEYQRDRVMSDIFDELSDPDTQIEMVNAVINADGTSIKVPKEVFDYIINTNQLVGDYVYEESIDGKIKNFASMTGQPYEESISMNPKSKNSLATVRSYVRVGNPDAWYLDPGRKEEILANPESYIEGGFFTDTSYTGVQSETNKMWALRTVLSPLNFVAGTLQEYVLEPTAVGLGGLAMEAVDTTGEVIDAVAGTNLSSELDINYLSGDAFAQPSEARTEARIATNPLYENNPVLANIALNKGFAGEMNDLADGLGMTGWTKFGMVSAGFAGDLLDPTFGIVAGAGKASKTARQLQLANKKLLQTKSASEIMKISAQSGLQEFMLDFNGISYLGGMATKRAKAATQADTVTKVFKADEITRTKDLVKRNKVAVAEAKVSGEGLENAELLLKQANEQLVTAKALRTEPGAITKAVASVEDVKQMPYGDIRLHFVDDLTKQMEARGAIRELAEAGKTGDEIAMELTERGYDINKGYAKQFFENEAKLGGEGGSRAAVDVTDGGDPFLQSFIKEWDNQNAFFKDLEGRARPDASGAYDNVRLSNTRWYSELPIDTKNLIDELVFARTGQRAKDLGGNWWAGNLNDVRGIVNQTLLRRNIFSAVPNIKNAGEIVAVTRSTWAHPTKVPNIIAASNSTKLGEVLGRVAEVFSDTKNVRLMNLESVGKGQVISGPGSLFLKSGLEVKPVYNISRELAKELSDQIDLIPNLGNRTRDRINQNLLGEEQGFITPEDFRVLKDANIDMTAKLMPAEMINVDDISKLSKSEQIRMLEAEGVRNQGFTGYVYENISEMARNRIRKGWQDDIIDTPMTATTFQQKRMFKEIQNESGTLDIRLKQQQQAMTSNKYRPEWDMARQLDYNYQFFGPRISELPKGIPTQSQALGAAIVGPRHQRFIDDAIPFVVKDGDGYKAATLDEFIASDKAALDEFLSKRAQVEENYKNLKENVGPTKKKAREAARKNRKDVREAIAAKEKELLDAIDAKLEARLKDLDDALERTIEDLESIGVERKKTFIRDNFKQPKKEAKAQAKEQKIRVRTGLKKEVDDLLKRIDEYETNIIDNIESDFSAFKDARKTLKEIEDTAGLKAPAGAEGKQIGGEFDEFEFDGVTNQELLFGPAALTNQASRISETARWAMNRIFFEAKEKPSFLDRVTGNQNMYRTDILNKQGRWKASQITDEFALRAMDEPDKFWFHFEEAVKQYDQLTRKAENIRVGVQTDKIVRNTGRDADGVYSLEQIRENQSKIGIGMYYYSQGSKIVERKLLQQVDEGVLLQSDIGNMPSEMAFQMNRVFTGKNELVVDAVQTEANAALATHLRYILQQELMTGKPMAPIDVVNNIFAMQKPKDAIFDVTGNVKTPAFAGFGLGKMAQNPTTPAEQLLSAFVNGTNDATRRGARGQMMREFDNLNAKYNAGTIDEGFELSELERLLVGLQEIDDVMTTAARTLEMADTIAKRNGVANKHFTNMDDVDDILDGLFGKGNEKVGISLLGVDQYKILKEQLYGSRSQKLTTELDKIFRETTVGDRQARATTSFLQGLGSTFYLMVLGLRSKFYTNNWLTAMPIVYSTTGQNLFRFDKGVGMMDARKIAYANPADASYYQTAIVDAAGRPWTYGELNERIMAGGARNEYSFITSNQGERLMAYTDDVGYKSFRDWFQRAQRAREGLGDVTLKEDYLWRASAMMHDLRAGKSIEEATATARRSMFDYGDMTPTEKALASNFLVFYTFHRQNVTHFLRSLTDARKLKRYVNTLKFDRGFELLAQAAQQEENGPDYVWNPNVFMSDYMSNRMVLYRKDVADNQNEQFYATSPALASHDAIAMTAQFLQEPVTMVGETLNSMTRPDLRYLIGLKGPFDKPPKRVMDQHIQAINLYSDNPNDIADVLSWSVGSKVTPVPSQRGVNGYIYPLTEGQAKQWSKNMQAIQSVGLMAPAAELSAIFQAGPYDSFSGGVKGTKFEPFGLPERFLFSQFRLGSPEQQEIYQLYLKSNALREELKAEEKRLREMQKQKQTP